MKRLNLVLESLRDRTLPDFSSRRNIVRTGSMTARSESDRRRFLRLGAGLAAGAGPVVSMLGCGGSSPTEPGAPPRPV